MPGSAIVSFLKVAKNDVLLCNIVYLLKVAKINIFLGNAMVSFYVLYILCICHDIIDKSWLPYQNLNRVLLVHLWIRSVKELLKIWNIFLTLMIRKGSYWCCVVVWRLYHQFATIMNDLLCQSCFIPNSNCQCPIYWCRWILSIWKGLRILQL